MNQGKRIKESGPKGEVFRANLKKFFDVATFRGLVFATILSGVILLFITPIVSNLMKPTSDGNLSNAIASDPVVPITEETEKVLAAIQKLSIGSTKDWVDDRLGPPFSENVVEITENRRVLLHTDESIVIGKVLECVYIFDVVSVITYFDTDKNSCEAFFVTLMEDISGIDIVMPEAYSFCVSSKPLGKFTFSDIDGGTEPLYIDGYTSNGVGRVFYGEQYYFAGGGNYQDFYFACLDYGLLDSLGEFDFLVTSAEFDIFEYNHSRNLSDMLAKLRCDLYPNTYGISTLNRNLTFSLFGSYTGFDSASFRKLR